MLARPRRHRLRPGRIHRRHLPPRHVGAGADRRHQIGQLTVTAVELPGFAEPIKGPWLVEQMRLRPVLRHELRLRLLRW